jgi:hypothetical protein
MYKTNLEYLDEVDDLIDLNLGDGDRFEDEAEKDDDGKPQKTCRVKKSRNPNNNYKFALVGDSNLKRSGHFLQEVFYWKATCLNSKESTGGLADALNFVIHLNNVKVVVVTALQNIINEEGIKDWKRTVTKFVCHHDLDCCHKTTRRAVCCSGTFFEDLEVGSWTPSEADI